jgi:hypothetical protein
MDATAAVLKTHSIAEYGVTVTDMGNTPVDRPRRTLGSILPLGKYAHPASRDGLVYF